MESSRKLVPSPMDGSRAPLAVEEYSLSTISLNVSPRQIASRPSLRQIPKDLERLGSIDSISLSWKDVNVFVKPPKNGILSCLRRSNTPEVPTRRILSDVTGQVVSGECLAVMGASGAGKTTLLNMLNGRHRESQLKMKGCITVNGHKIGQGITSISGYVQQTDLAMPTLTVREHLNFHAALRMDQRISPTERRERVEDVIRDLGLSNCSDVQIGDSKRKGISGGEMKRLQFGSEVLTDPPLLFCDEPTTGLDSFMAQTVVGVMRDLAAKGKTILCTIHQPSSEVFVMFDKLLLMAEGRVAYIGPRSEASGFFASVGLPLIEDYNPADFFVHTLAITPGQEEECRAKVANICDKFEESDLGRMNVSLAEKSVVDGNDIHLEKRSPYKATWMQQMNAVFRRSIVTMWREPMLLRLRIIQCIVLGLLFGLIFFQQKMTNEGVQNLNGLVYMFLMQMTMGNVFAVISTFTGELVIFLKEHDSGMYRSDVYYICKTLVDLPVFVVIPFVMVTIAYWMAAMNSAWQAYLVACCVLALVANAAVSFGYIFSCACNSTQTAIGMGMTLLMPLTLFGGLFINLRTIPAWLNWIAHLSWFRYANEVLLVNQWETVERIDCGVANFTCAASGQEILDRLDFSSANYSMDIGILFAMILAFRVVAYTFLYFRTQK
ncbi:Protein white [Hypsibius exemplaris]|uniref:Protein white n=1 Tax=Hypsibius exemplaris TaxID=2072580 RepID=A0A1W0X8Y4_HYPEX|nr:Protein white [Hypsibius exemplaris]